MNQGIQGQESVLLEIRRMTAGHVIPGLGLALGASMIIRSLAEMRRTCRAITETKASEQWDIYWSCKHQTFFPK